jgi:hypothetical protein
MKFSESRRFRKALLVGLIVFLVYISAVSIIEITNTIVKKTTKIQQAQQVVEYFSGAKQPVRILVLFENNAEIRPGGGFIGTVGVIELENGKIKSDPIRSVYAYEYLLRENPIFEADPSVDGGQVGINLRDSGQNLDWPRNAERAIRVFEHQSGRPIDGVIAVTPNVLLELLRKTGPVYLEDYQKTVTAENFTDTVQLEVEAGQDKVERKDPKTILSSLANTMLAKLSSKSIGELSDYGKEFRQLLSSRQILMYSRDSEVQAALQGLQYDGRLIDYDADYLLISENNIGGDKSSPYIDRKQDRKITILEDGTVNEDLTLTRIHTSDYKYPYVDAANGQGTWLVQINKTYLKIAVPAGTKFTGNSPNVDLKYHGREGRYDVYGFTSELMPLGQDTYRLSYNLPYKVALHDQVTVNTYQQYQNGGFPITSRLSVHMPQGYQLQATNKQSVFEDETGGVGYNNSIEQDEFASFIYEKIQQK